MPEATCPYCRTTLEARDKAESCPTCRTPHHTDCWLENGGCSVFGCTAAPDPDGGIVIDEDDLDMDENPDEEEDNNKKDDNGCCGCLFWILFLGYWAGKSYGFF